MGIEYLPVPTTNDYEPEGDRLNGWKEIASYLNKSVSSVQRWERELKLPVRRLKTAEGQIVSASRREIDTWRNGLERGALVEATSEPVTGSPAVPRSPAPARDARTKWLWPMAFAVLVSVGWLAWSTFRSSPPRKMAADFALVGRALEAREASGSVVWSSAFDSEVSPPAKMPRGGGRTAVVLDADLDGDGVTELLVPVRMARPGVFPQSSDAVYAFSAAGDKLWSVAPAQRFSCRGKVHQGPWEISALLVTGEPGRQRIWAAYVHASSWPSFVVEVTPNGRATTRYVQTGWILSLAGVSTPAGYRLAAGGVIHPEDRPSVVFLDPDGPPAMNPHSAPGFDCEDLPTAPPEQIILLPNGEVVSADGHPYLMVDSLKLRSGLEAEIGSHLIVHFDQQMPSHVVFSDIYWANHRELETRGKLSHSAVRCPAAGAQEIQTWTAATGWSRRMVPSANKAVEVAR